MTRSRIQPGVTTLFVAVLSLFLLGVVPSAGAGGSKQQVCHRTGSSSNRYVGIQPSSNAKGHDSSHHQGTAANPDNDKRGAGWTKGPHQSNSACAQDRPPDPDPLPCANPPCGPDPDPVIPPFDIGEPAEPIIGQPTVTG